MHEREVRDVHCAMPSALPPMVATLPLLHGCWRIHWTVSSMSSAPLRQKLKLPVLKNRPRKSWPITAYPRATHPAAAPPMFTAPYGVRSMITGSDLFAGVSDGK